jgi:hypothetical protein
MLVIAIGLMILTTEQLIIMSGNTKAPNASLEDTDWLFPDH